jgi:hypothetical protein
MAVWQSAHEVLLDSSQDVQKRVCGIRESHATDKGVDERANNLVHLVYSLVPSGGEITKDDIVGANI